MTEEAYESALRQALNELAEVDKQAEDIERKRAKLRQSVAVLQTLAGDSREQERSVTNSIVTILRANPGPLPTVQIVQRLISMGHKPQPASVATLLSRLAQQGKITKADDGYEWRNIRLPKPSPEGSHQMDAFVQRFSRAVCFFIAAVPTDGSASPATALLVQFKGQKYLVTALHNFFHDLGGKEQVVQSWQATRFGFRDQSPLERVESMNMAAMRAKSERGTMLPLSSPDDLLIDEIHDLLAVKVDTSWKELEHVAFIDLESEIFTRELTTGLSMVMVGVTLSSTVSTPWMLPTLIPQTDHVVFDSDLDTDGMTHNWYSPDYFFIPFSLAEDGIDPHGFSGAPIFVNKEPATERLWIASPHVVGIVLRYFRRKKLVVAVKIQTVIELLKTDHSQDRSSSISNRTARAIGVEAATSETTEASTQVVLDLEAARHSIVSALIDARHGSAAQMLGSGTWTLDGESLRIEVPGMGKKMLALTVNAAAEKIIRQELQRLGAFTRFLVVPGESSGKLTGSDVNAGGEK